ncbi:TolC family protein [Methylotenera sp. N17]|jgi:outer membrane protein TolC|uniref:TolC family protein n=1 Tax=Methylotenera sp. N17 TaxID=1502761 RepID=UPI00068F7336|nr:TolC family protein [Methylotenera sp. N17]
MQPTFRNTFSICSITLILLGCAHQTYSAKPLDAAQSARKLSQKSLDNPEFRAYLVRNGVADTAIPFQSWDLSTLTHTALFYHTNLVVVKEKLALAEYSIQAAGLKPALGINGTIARSDRANGDINPMSYGLQVDIPFETTAKRAVKVEEAQHLAEVARMDAAEIAWQLRHQLQIDLIDYQAHQHQLTLLQQEIALYRQLVDMLQKRVATGLGSNTELAQYQLLLQKSQIQLRNESAKTDGYKIKLAADTGLSYAQFNVIPIAPLTEAITAQAQSEITAQALQTDALINRIDIRRGLARYAVAESKLKLEIAKQVPDITLTPGYIFEFGDRIWSLGLGTLLNLLQQQPTLIHEAELLRTIEGAQFEALQASVIAQVEQVHAQYQLAITTFEHAKESHAAQRLYIASIQKQFDAGLIDRVALTQAQLVLSVANQDLNNATFDVLKKRALLENVVQRPLPYDNATLRTVKHDE